MYTLHQYEDPNTLATHYAKSFKAQLSRKAKINIALSGGSTPKLLFQHWATHYADSIDWSRLHFYWGDERCVSPKDEQSNYKMTRDLLLQHITIPKANIHRIKGEKDPPKEALRYSREILKHVPLKKGLPQFDLILLGMGSDGHTASIFPHQMDLLEASTICAVATHPDSGQKRITLTGPVLNNAQKVAFLITGASKQKVLSSILHQKRGWRQYPTAHIRPVGHLSYHLDSAALTGK